MQVLHQLFRNDPRVTWRSRSVYCKTKEMTRLFLKAIRRTNVLRRRMSNLKAEIIRLLKDNNPALRDLISLMSEEEVICGIQFAVIKEN